MYINYIQKKNYLSIFIQMRFRNLLILFAYTLTLLLVNNTNILAQEEETSISLGYAPVSQELKINPGTTYKDSVTIWNLSEKEIEYFIIVRGFKQLEDHPGTAILLSEEQDLVSTSSASSWFEVETDSILVPSQYNFELDFTITVPEDAAPAEYYAQIFFFTDQKSDLPDAVRTVNNLGGGPTFLIKTGDDLTESMDLLEFKSTKKVYESPNVTLNTSISNTGNTHIKPKGVIILTNMFNQELATIEFNSTEQAILRDTIATYITKWDSNYLLTDEGKLAVGPIKAEITLNYKSDSPGYSPITGSTEFWIFQWKLALAVLGIIILIIWTIRSIKKNKKNKETQNIPTITPTPPVQQPIPNPPPQQAPTMQAPVQAQQQMPNLNNLNNNVPQANHTQSNPQPPTQNSNV
jgi:hypothetical protein